MRGDNEALKGHALQGARTRTASGYRRTPSVRCRSLLLYTARWFTVRKDAPMVFVGRSALRVLYRSGHSFGDVVNLLLPRRPATTRTLLTQ
jgi:hypothetical protein